MPLERSSEPPTVLWRMNGVLFVMMSGSLRVVCLVSLDALAEKAAFAGKPCHSPLEIFEQFRVEIEDAARAKYEARVPDPVLISAKVLSPTERVAVHSGRNR